LRTAEVENIVVDNFWISYKKTKFEIFKHLFEFIASQTSVFSPERKINPTGSEVVGKILKEAFKNSFNL
jgi:hypothetical protein